jgi:hypothetical protein
MQQENVALERVVMTLWRECAPPGNAASGEACERRRLWEVMKTSTAGRQACSKEELPVYLICLTEGAKAYDIVVRSGWDQARAFRWESWDAGSKAAMRTLAARSEEACTGKSGADHDRCYRDNLADKLGLPKEDSAACAAMSERGDVERCLKRAHGYRFMEAAAGRLPGEG